MSGEILLPWEAWYRDGEHRLEVPHNFRCSLLAHQGGCALSLQEIMERLSNPLDCQPLPELARKARTACIAVDDLTRPTRTLDVLPWILSTLNDNGISKNHVRIVIATGSHAGPAAAEKHLKLGPEILESYSVESHDCRGKLTGTGISYGDQELKINTAFMEAELRIVIGAALPHSFAGFSGGAKMVLPGLANLEAIRRSHKLVQLGRRVSTDLNDNIFRSEAEKIIQDIRVDFCVNLVTNSRRETIGLAAGDVVSAHRCASELGAAAYRTGLKTTFDVGLLNSYPKDGDLVQAATSFIPFKGLKQPMVREGGVYILASATWHGVGEHGVYGAESSSRIPGPLRQLAGRELWLYTPRLKAQEVHQLFWDQYPVFSDGAELCTALAQRFPEGADLGVLPCAPLQQLHDWRTPPGQLSGSMS